MAITNKTIEDKFKSLGSIFDDTGLSVSADRRYVLIQAYVSIGTSYRAVLLGAKGHAFGYTTPKDAKAVGQVFKDFGNPKQLKSKEWWSEIGSKLYGVAAPVGDIKVFGKLDSSNSSVTVKWRGADSLVLKVPLNLTLPDAMKKLRKELEQHKFAEKLPAQLEPKYKLTNSKLSFATLLKGVLALNLYMKGKPLWYIGNYLSLIPAQAFSLTDEMKMIPAELAYRKEMLSIAASRLVKKAILVAENAARGRFPCDKPFAEAQVDQYNRKAGRPVGSTRAKRKKAG
jgi:hypothetical protein